jgi:hypothetical protein
MTTVIIADITDLKVCGGLYSWATSAGDGLDSLGNILRI